MCPQRSAGRVGGHAPDRPRRPRPDPLLAPPAHAAVDADALGALIDRSLDGMMARQVESGFDDPFGGGPKFNYGAVALAGLAGRRAVPGPAGDARRLAAAPPLRAGSRV